MRISWLYLQMRSVRLAEPGCAIKKAVDDGLISAERYQNYLNILKDVTSSGI